MTALPRLAALATAVPEHVLKQEDVAEASAALFGDALGVFSRLAPIYQNARIETRYACMPLDWYLQPHGFGERNRLYVARALDLLERAASDCLSMARLGIGDVDGLVVVSSSGIATPSLDALLLERLRGRRDAERLPVFGLGCAGGVMGLARAAQIARARPRARILFLVVELCTLTFQPLDRSMSNLVATALFGDGAAAALVSCRDPGPAIVGSGEHTWADSLDVMGWDVGDSGLAVIFSQSIPSLVQAEFGSALDGYLRRQGLSLDAVDTFVCHPGGAKVLDALESVFGVEPGGLGHARRVLRDYGNMSASTVLFVLKEALAAVGRGRFLLSAFGPGFTAAFATIEADGGLPA